MPTKRKNGVYYVDRVFPLVGRINRTLGTEHKSTATYKEQVLQRLAETGQIEALKSFRDGGLTIDELVYAFENNKVTEVINMGRGDRKVEDLIPKFVNELSGEIKTAYRYGKSLRALTRWKPGIRVTHLAKSETINEFKAARKNVSRATITRDLSAIHRFLDWYGGRKLARRAFDDVRWPKAVPRRTRRLTPDEIRRLLDAAHQPYRDMIYTMLVTGMRPTEVCRLTWSEVYPDEFEIRLRESKTDSGVRDIPITPELLDVLRRHAGNFRPHEPLFGKTYERMTIAIRKAKKRAGLVDFIPRDLRRTHAQYFREANPDVVRARDQLGHSSIAHTEAYLGASRSNDRRATVEVATELMGL